MTKWSEMSARERDALVAMKVMGWEVVRGTVIPPGYDSWSKPNVPHYTTDISAAWEVVEKLAREGWSPRIEWDATHQEWDVRFVDRTGYPKGMALHAVAPEAICLAALRAKGVDVES